MKSEQKLDFDVSTIEGKTYEYYYVVKDFLVDHSKPFIYKLIK